MKAIMISTRPQWVEKTLNGIKKDEIRKGTRLYKAINRLIKEQGVAPMLIYCTHGKHLLDLRKEDTKDNYRLTNQNKSNNVRWSYPPIINGKVVARFNATAEEINATNLEKFAKDSCLTIRELEEYLWSNILSGTAIHINDLKIFDKPKEISEFRQWFDCEKCWCVDNQDCLMNKQCPKHTLSRAPQSWCYVEL